MPSFDAACGFLLLLLFSGFSFLDGTSSASHCLSCTIPDVENVQDSLSGNANRRRQWTQLPRNATS